MFHQPLEVFLVTYCIARTTKGANVQAITDDFYKFPFFFFTACDRQLHVCTDNTNSFLGVDTTGANSTSTAWFISRLFNISGKGIIAKHTLIIWRVLYWRSWWHFGSGCTSSRFFSIQESPFKSKAWWWWRRGHDVVRFYPCWSCATCPLVLFATFCVCVLWWVWLTETVIMMRFFFDRNGDNDAFLFSNQIMCPASACSSVGVFQRVCCPIQPKPAIIRRKTCVSDATKNRRQPSSTEKRVRARCDGLHGSTSGPTTRITRYQYCTVVLLLCEIFAFWRFSKNLADYFKDYRYNQVQPLMVQPCTRSKILFYIILK